jgi:hypothetical protein
MSRPHPKHEVDLPLSREIFLKLESAAIDTGYRKEAWELGEAAILQWVARNHPDAIASSAHRGYQWKQLFLPDGTVLRTVFRGVNHHCIVEGDRLRYKGEDVSPSGFSNAVGGLRRSAWRCTWVLFPGATVWQSAASLRTPARRRAPGARSS